MNVCKTICPVFSGQCVPSECDIFRNKESDLYDENSKLRDRITRLKLDNETIKRELVTAVENNIKLRTDVGYYTDQAFWAETALEKITKDRDSLLEQTVILKKEIDQHLKTISELHDRYDDVRGR